MGIPLETTISMEIMYHSLKFVSRASLLGEAFIHDALTEVSQANGATRLYPLRNVVSPSIIVYHVSKGF